MTIKIEGKMSNGLDIRICRTPEDFDLGRKVSQDYAHWLQEPLCTKSFDQEMTEFESYYSLPQGLFLLAELDGKIAGGVGLHKTDFFTGEIKRLYVYPDFRGRGLGVYLCEKLLTWAENMHLESLFLVTLPRLGSALAIYRELGFHTTRTNKDGSLLLELNLQDYRKDQSL
jgi:putative acetyltransferase